MHTCVNFKLITDKTTDIQWFWFLFSYSSGNLNCEKRARNTFDLLNETETDETKTEK